MTDIIQVFLYVLAGVLLILLSAIFTVIIRYGVPYALYRIERHKRGTVPTSEGPLYPPTNSELRRARREHPQHGNE